jgi:hypothetical protein
MKLSINEKNKNLNGIYQGRRFLIQPVDNIYFNILPGKPSQRTREGSTERIKCVLLSNHSTHPWH